MTTGLYRVYWRGNPEFKEMQSSDARLNWSHWDFLAGFVELDDAQLWIKTEQNGMSDPEEFEWKITHNNKRFPL